MSTTLDTAATAATTPAAPADQTTTAQATAQAEAPRISPRTGKPMRPYVRKRPFVPRPQNLPKPTPAEELARQQANQHLAAARNLQAFGTETPPTWPEMPHFPTFNPQEPGDLLLLPDRSRARTLLFLEKFAVYRRYNEAVKEAQVQYWEVEQAKRISKTYADMFDDIRQTILQGRVTDIETALAADAAGEDPEPGRRRPDNRNAALFLAANDPRYKPQATGGGATVVFDVHF